LVWLSSSFLHTKFTGEYDQWRDNKNSFNLIWKYLRKSNIHWPILTFYDFNIHRNSCSCYPSKYFRIWNDNEVTDEISFGLGIWFFNRFVQKLFSYILFKWPYSYWHISIYEVYYVANEKKIHCAYALNFESKEATISFDPTLNAISLILKIFHEKNYHISSLIFYKDVSALFMLGELQPYAHCKMLKFV
jgi:hypothetical protein